MTTPDDAVNEARAVYLDAVRRFADRRKRRRGRQAPVREMLKLHELRMRYVHELIEARRTDGQG